MVLSIAPVFFQNLHRFHSSLDIQLRSLPLEPRASINDKTVLQGQEGDGYAIVRKATTSICWNSRLRPKCWDSGVDILQQAQ